MPNIRRKFSGPNGLNNYIPDNGLYTFTRNPAGNVIRIDVAGPATQAFHRIVTRNVAERVTDVGYWIQDSI